MFLKHYQQLSIVSIHIAVTIAFRSPKWRLVGEYEWWF